MNDFDNARNVVTRILKAYNFKTSKELADLVGITSGSMSNRITRNVYPADLIIRCSEDTGANIKWLATGDGEQFSDDIKQKENTFQVDVLDVTASAGAGYFVSDVKEVVQSINYEKAEAKLLFNGLSEQNLKIINIAGDSMQPTFESGDLIFVDVSRNRFEGDGIYVFTYGRALFVKRLQLVKNVIQVLSDNPSYKDWELTEADNDELFIHGKVMLSQSSLLRKHG